MGGGVAGRISPAIEGVVGRAVEEEEFSMLYEDLRDRLGRGEPGTPPPMPLL
jgi:hypothetical protein